jgi:hypothetical protein
MMVVVLVAEITWTLIHSGTERSRHSVEMTCSALQSSSWVVRPGSLSSG